MLKENLNEFLEINAKDIVDIVFLAGLETDEQKPLKEQKSSQTDGDIIAFNVISETQSEVFEVDFDHVINAVVASITKTANIPTKGVPFIEPIEIENIKNSLDRVSGNNEAFAEVKNELTNFQNQIKSNYAKKVKDYNIERMAYDREILMLEEAKKEIVMARASKMLWPFDEKTRAIDKKVEVLKIKSQRCAQKVSDILTMRPAANEKDLLIFKSQLKEKFSI